MRTNSRGYDYWGNVTKIGADQYVWDDADRLIGYDGAGTINDATFGYFPASWQRAKRVKQQTPPLTRLFAWDGADLQGLYDQNGARMWRFETPGLDNHLSGFTNGNTYYFMKDAQGSIRNVADSGQNTQSTYDYRAYGESLGTYSQMVQSPFRYTGALYENWHGMPYYMRNRTYMPGVGLFSSRDAMWADAAGGWGYVANNPANWTDPEGLYVVIIGFGGSQADNQAAADAAMQAIDNMLDLYENNGASGDVAEALRNLLEMVNDPNQQFPLFVAAKKRKGQDNASPRTVYGPNGPSGRDEHKRATKRYGTPGDGAVVCVVPPRNGSTPNYDGGPIPAPRKVPAETWIPGYMKGDKSVPDIFPDELMPFIMCEYIHESQHAWGYWKGKPKTGEEAEEALNALERNFGLQYYKKRGLE